MARCGCSGACSCALTVEDTDTVVLTLEGNGRAATPWVLSAEVIGLIGGDGDIVVEDEGTVVLAAATRLNFVGPGVLVTDAGSGEVTVSILTPSVGTGLATTGTIDLDMAALDSTYQTISLTGNPTFTTSNRLAGRVITIKLIAGASPRTITWPAWIPLAAALPTTLAAGKVAVFTVTFWDGTDAAATAAYAAQP